MVNCVKNLPETNVTIDPLSTACHKSAGLGKLVDGSASFVLVTGSTATLPNSAAISSVELLASCFRDALYNIYWDNDGVPVQLASTIRTTAGRTTEVFKLDCEAFTTGATGPQTLYVEAKNQNALSDIDASVRASQTL